MGADAPAPITSLVAGSCELEGMQKYRVSQKKELAICVQKLQ